MAEHGQNPNRTSATDDQLEEATRAMENLRLLNQTAPIPISMQPALAKIDSEDYTTRVEGKRPTVSKFEFDGNRVNFLSWKLYIIHKLTTEAGFIGDVTNRFVFIWDSISPTVRTKIAPWFATNLERPVPSKFLEYLTQVYGDRHARERAMAQFEHIQQGTNELFNEYMVRWYEMETQSGAQDNTTEQRLGKLRRSLTPKMQDVAMNRGVSRTDWELALLAYGNIALDLETMAWDRKGRTLPTAPTKTNNAVPTQTPLATDRDGDVIMTGINLTRTKGKSRQKRGQNNPAWIPDDIYKQRMERGACTRCGEKGHKARTCPNAINVVSVNTVKSVQQEDDDSGNE